MPTNSNEFYAICAHMDKIHQNYRKIVLGIVAHDKNEARIPEKIEKKLLSYLQGASKQIDLAASFFEENKPEEDFTTKDTKNQ